ncbi:MAG: hypothetical protein WA144_14810 [Candidatus Methanoperedens sp.]|jgi:hypothetical protein
MKNTNIKIEENPVLEILRVIQSDMTFMKQKIISLEEEINEISSDLHREINPEFLERLETIQKQKGIRFNSMKEFEDFIE